MNCVLLAWPAFLTCVAAGLLALNDWSSDGGLAFIAGCLLGVSSAFVVLWLLLWRLSARRQSERRAI
jgi:hypothetical protein